VPGHLEAGNQEAAKTMPTPKLSGFRRQIKHLRTRTLRGPARHVKLIDRFWCAVPLSLTLSESLPRRTSGAGKAEGVVGPRAQAQVGDQHTAALLLQLVEALAERREGLCTIDALHFGCQRHVLLETSKTHMSLGIQQGAKTLLVLLTATATATATTGQSKLLIAVGVTSSRSARI